MAWEHLSVNKPHLVYLILGGFTSLFMLCSSFIKEKMYIGEATVATLCGIIFGPHAADLINPMTWGNTDQITLEFSRIVLVVQCFAVGVELPKYYMEKHWRSVIFLLLPVMTFGWLITSLFIWWLIVPLTWLESLCVSACVTATDPVLASSVVGKGKFAKRIPKHLRDLLSAESGCNDGMAFPFIYLALYLIHYRHSSKDVAFHWIVLTILYECVFGAFYGFMIGYIGRHGIKFAEKKDLVDRESFLVFYFVLALFCAGSGSILGVDDLLVGFAAGIGFSNDGWFTQKTEESHVSNVIDLLINLAYFVYLGTIIPWEQFNTPEIGITPWRLVVISIFVLLFRRIPIMLALKPLIPDIKTWREALFAGHFGPIGVGAIFIAILARAELQTGHTTPLAEYKDPAAENYLVVTLIWPITVFLVVVSILVHGSSIAVFTLGRHLNTLTLTMSYTKADEDGPSWMNRLPRITTTSKSQAKSFNSENDADMDLPPGSLPPTGVSGEFSRRQNSEGRERHSSRSSSVIPRRRKKKDHGAGGPVSESAIYPQRRITQESTSDTLTQNSSPDKASSEEYNEKGEGELGEIQHDGEMQEILSRHAQGDHENHGSAAERHPQKREVYEEGDDYIIENEDGDVIRTVESTSKSRSRSHSAARQHSPGAEKSKTAPPAEMTQATQSGDYMNYRKYRKNFETWRHRDDAENPNNIPKQRGAAHAYQVGNTVVIEDEDGEVIKTYELPGKEGAPARPLAPRKLSTWAGLGGLMGRKESVGDSSLEKQPEDAQPESSQQASAVRQGLARMGTWGFGGKTDVAEKKDVTQDDDSRIRFTIGTAGQRLTKEDFLKQISTLDPKARVAAVERSNASPALKEAVKKRASESGESGANAPRARGTAQPRAARAAETSGDSDSEMDIKQRSAKGALQLSRKKDAPIASSSGGHRLGKVASYEDDEPETAAERKRREKAMKGVHEADTRPVSSASSTDKRGRDSHPRTVDVDEDHSGGYFTETPAEKRRREAALGLGSSSLGGDAARDENKFEEPTMPKPAVQPLRGIRFADEERKR